MCLPEKPIHDPQDEAQDDAENDARCNGKDERSVLAAISDIAGKTSERNTCAVGKKDTEPNHDQQSTNPDEKLAQRPHPYILARLGAVSPGL